MRRGRILIFVLLIVVVGLVVAVVALRNLCFRLHNQQLLRMWKFMLPAKISRRGRKSLRMCWLLRLCLRT